MPRIISAIIGTLSLALAVVELDGRLWQEVFQFHPLRNPWHWILGISALAIATTNQNASRWYCRGAGALLVLAALGSAAWGQLNYASAYGLVGALALIGGFAKAEGLPRRGR